MNNRGRKTILFLSLTASVIIVIQILSLAFRGEAVCLNAGCKVVEGLTMVPPLYLNLTGFVYFQAIFWLYSLLLRQPPKSEFLPGILLLIGLAVEAVLLSYQIFVARSFCSYCLIIFAIVVLINLLAGWRHLLTGAAIVAGIILMFSLLSFSPALLVLSRNQALSAGTYGTRTCSNPAKELFLFFSASCPHCQNVIKALENCNSCDFHFNPVSKLQSLELQGLVLAKDYSIDVNRLMLSMLDIKEIPVLIAKDSAGLSIIKGEQRIIHYIEQACYNAKPLLYLEKSPDIGQSGMSVYGDEGECSMTIDCDGDGEQR